MCSGLQACRVMWAQIGLLCGLGHMGPQSRLGTGSRLGLLMVCGRSRSCGREWGLLSGEVVGLEVGDGLGGCPWSLVLWDLRKY